MKKWCALLMTLLLILTTAGAEEFSGGKDFWDDAYRCTVENGYLTFQSDDGTTYQPIAVREGFAKAAKALAAQGDTFVAVPMGLTQALLPYVADELTGGAELVEIYCTTALVGMHLRDAAKGDVLRVAWWTGDGYQMVDKVVGVDFSLDRRSQHGSRRTGIRLEAAKWKTRFVVHRRQENCVHSATRYR